MSLWPNVYNSKYRFLFTHHINKTKQNKNFKMKINKVNYNFFLIANFLK
jgi:hypothetical protein